MTTGGRAWMRTWAWRSHRPEPRALQPSAWCPGTLTLGCKMGLATLPLGCDEDNVLRPPHGASRPGTAPSRDRHWVQGTPPHPQAAPGLPACSSFQGSLRGKGRGTGVPTPGEKQRGEAITSSGIKGLPPTVPQSREGTTGTGAAWPAWHCLGTEVALSFSLAGLPMCPSGRWHPCKAPCQSETLTSSDQDPVASPITSLGTAGAGPLPEPPAVPSLPPHPSPTPLGLQGPRTCL